MEATLNDISRLQSTIAQTEEDKGKLFPEEETYLTKKARHTELKDLLRQQTSDDIMAIRDVTDDFDLEM